MDEQTVGIDLTAVDQMPRACQAITDIDHAPLLVEAVPVVATVPGAATVVDVEVREATAGPELHGGIQREVWSDDVGPPCARSSSGGLRPGSGTTPSFRGA